MHVSHTTKFIDINYSSTGTCSRYRLWNGRGIKITWEGVGQRTAKNCCSILRSNTNDKIAGRLVVCLQCVDSIASCADANRQPIVADKDAFGSIFRRHPLFLGVLSTSGCNVALCCRTG